MHIAKDFSAFNVALPMKDCGCTRSWEGTLPGQLIPKRYPILYGIMLSNRSGEKKEEGKDVWSAGICLPKKTVQLTGQAFLEVAEHLPANGN